MQEWKTPETPSKTKAAVRAYQRTHFATISANVPRQFKEEFREACKNAGTTMHGAIMEFAAHFIADNA